MMYKNNEFTWDLILAPAVIGLFFDDRSTGSGKRRRMNSLCDDCTSSIKSLEKMSRLRSQNPSTS